MIIRKLHCNTNPVFGHAYRVYSWMGHIGYCNIYPQDDYYNLNVSKAIEEQRNAAREEEIEYEAMMKAFNLKDEI